jgi:hypothetical protein
MLNPSCCSVLTFVSFLVNLSFNLSLDLIIVLLRLWIFCSVPKGKCFISSFLVIIIYSYLDLVMWGRLSKAIGGNRYKEGVKKIIFWFWFYVLKSVWDTVNKRAIKKGENSLQPQENFSAVDHFLSISKLALSVYLFLSLVQNKFPDRLR